VAVPPRGIIIRDPSIATGLVKAGLDAGLIKFKEPDSDEVRSLIEREKADIAHCTSDTQALELLLLYGKLYLHEIELSHLDLTGMVNEDLCEIAPWAPFQRKDGPLGVVVPEEEAKLFPMLEGLVSYPYFLHFFDSFASDYPEVFPDFSHNRNDIIYALATSSQYQLEVKERAGDLSRRKFAGTEQDIENALAKPFAAVGYCILILHSTYSALRCSADLRIPAFFVPTTDTEPAPTPVKLKVPSNREYWQAYQIYLSEAEQVPAVKRMQDVLRLREDRKLTDFRNRVYEWSMALRSGDINAEQRIRKEIASANQALKSLGTCRKAGRILTYLGLPIGVATTLFGMPPQAGLCMSAVGLAIELGARQIEWNKRWTLVGR